MIARVAMALPMLAASQGLPVVREDRRARSASRMPAVITTLRETAK